MDGIYLTTIANSFQLNKIGIKGMISKYALKVVSKFELDLFVALKILGAQRKHKGHEGEKTH